ncbi:MAG: hypothetical protein HOV78_20255 [Hamadaea sp.]|nr:hypothetical protein [Hamadaea sp.]NUO90614.1 hypothetical protein [Dermatophilaceae bacterium]
MSETSVGAIVGYLQLDASDWHREIAQADREVEKLDGKDAHVQIKVDGGAKAKAEIDSVAVASEKLKDANVRLSIAQARLNEVRQRGNAKASQILTAERAVAVATRNVERASRDATSAQEALSKANDHVETSNRRVERSAQGAHRNTRALVTAIGILGPALVPVAAGAVGLGVAFGGMGAAGVLAIVGINNEMKKGTTLGLTYKAALDSGKNTLNGLAKTAAGNVLGPLQAAVVDLNRRFPTLNGQVGELSTLAGKSAGAVTSGLVSAFIALNPLMRDAGVYTLDLSNRFSSAMSGGGVVAFGDYVRSVFPQVMQAIESLVTTAGHLVTGFAPLGMGTLTTLRTLADLINAMPIDVLQSLATTAGSVYIGFQAWKGLQSLTSGLGGALEKLGVSGEKAAAGMRAVNIASGVIGAALAVLSIIISRNAETQRENQQAANDYADALRRSNGVVDESIRQMTAKKLADDGVLDAARKLGIALPDVTNAALGNADAQARVNAVIDAQAGKLKIMTTGAKSGVQANTDLGDAADKVTGAIGRNNGQLDAGIQKNKDIAAATAVAKTNVSAQATAVQDLAFKYGGTVPVLQAVQDAQKKAADQHAAATIQMQMENDAAGLLKQSLDALNGKALNAAEAQNAFDSSLANMGDHVTKTGKKVTFTTTSINNMSAASVALRGQLNGQVANLQRVVEANGGLSGSTGKAREQMVAMRKQIIDNAVAHGVDRKAVTEYIDKLLKIPPSVPPTKLDVDKAAAQSKAQEFIGIVNGIPQFRSITLSVGAIFSNAAREAISAAGSGVLSIGASVAKAAKHADGGTVVGPGGPREDKVMTWLSPGEEVIKNGPAQKHRALLKAINAGKFADGGTVGGARFGGSFATGGTVAPLGQFLSDYLSGLGEKVTNAVMAGLRAGVTTARTGVTTAQKAQSTHAANRADSYRKDRAAIADAESDVRHARSRAQRAAAQRRLAEAEAKYQRDRRNGDLQAVRDTNAVAAAKDKLAKATKAVGDAEARAKKQAESPLVQFQKANAVGIKNAGAFIANLQKLAARGYGTLAQQLAAMGGEEAEKIAAQAANASTKTLDGISAQVGTATTQAKKLDNMTGITTILSATKSKNLSVRELAAQSGMSVEDIIAALSLVKGDLKGNKNAGKLLADLANYESGKLFANGGQIPGFAGGTVIGPGTGTSDSILAMVAQSRKVLRVSAGEFLSTDGSRRRNEVALQAGNRGATLQVAGAARPEGPIELGEASLQRLASMLSRTPIQATVSASTFDRALAVGL